AREQIDDELADLAGVLVRRVVAEPTEAGGALVAAEAEVALGLATDGHECVTAAGEHVGLDLALGGALHVGVVATAQTTVGGDHDVADLLDLVATLQQRRTGATARSRQVLHHGGDLFAVGHGGLHALLGLHDAGRSDQLHGARDLLRGLDAANASS